jgi:biotin carboxylase
MRVLLIVTTRSYRAGAFLDAIEKLGWQAVVASERPQALHMFNPGGHLTLDFDDLDDAAGRIVRFSDSHPIDVVVGADDDGVLVAAVAAERLGLRHASSEAVRTCRDKGRMRGLLAAAGLPGPRFERVALEADPASAARRLFYPCVLKPASLSGSRGVIRVNDETEFVRAFHRVRNIVQAARAEQGSPVTAGESILVESYLGGEEVALEGVLTRGRLHRFTIFEKPDELVGPFFEETMYVTPSRYTEDQIAAIERCVSAAAEAIGLDEGPVHAEVRFNSEHVTLVEIAPRSIGGLCSRALRFQGGVSLEEVLLRQASGEDPAQFEREPRASGVLMIPIPHAGILREIDGVEAASSVGGVEELRLVVPPGQPVAPPPEGGRYLGFIFSRGDGPRNVEQALRQAHRKLRIRIDPESSPGGAGIERTTC